MQYHNFPNITPQARTILDILLKEGMLVGGTLMRLSNLRSTNEFIKPVHELFNLHLIEISGNVDEYYLPFAIFGTVPSARKYLEIVVQINEPKIQYA